MWQQLLSKSNVQSWCWGSGALNYSAGRGSLSGGSVRESSEGAGVTSPRSREAQQFLQTASFKFRESSQGLKVDDANDSGVYLSKIWSNGSLPPVATLTNCLMSDSNHNFAILSDINKVVVCSSLPPQSLEDSSGASNAKSRSTFSEPVTLEFTDSTLAHCLSDDGFILAVGCRTSISVFTIDNTTSSVVRANSLQVFYTPNSITVAPIYSKLISGEWNRDYYIAVSSSAGVFIYSISPASDWAIQEVTVLHEAHYTCDVTFSSDASMLAIGALDGHLAIWHLHKSTDFNDAETFFDYLDKDRIIQLAFSPQQLALAIGFWDGTFCIFNRRNRESTAWQRMKYRLKCTNEIKDKANPGTFVCWSANEQYVAYTHSSRVIIAEVKSGLPYAVLNLSNLRVFHKTPAIKGITSIHKHGIFVIYERSQNCIICQWPVTTFMKLPLDGCNDALLLAANEHGRVYYLTQPTEPIYCAPPKLKVIWDDKEVITSIPFVPSETFLTYASSPSETMRSYNDTILNLRKFTENLFCQVSTCDPLLSLSESSLTLTLDNKRVFVFDRKTSEWTINS